MEKPKKAKMHQQTSQQQTEDQDLRVDNVNQPLKPCKVQIDFY